MAIKAIMGWLGFHKAVEAPPEVLHYAQQIGWRCVPACRSQGSTCFASDRAIGEIERSRVILTLVRLQRWGNRMKEIIIKVDDELYDRAKESVADLESSVNEQVKSYLKALNGDDARIAAARSRMKELFNT